ncbi:MAG: PDZ domain-containing protein [Deltaproteobacteria bacterium]|nr:PDZ domain-containing protein [Deltaproteobacteria bacterium]
MRKFTGYRQVFFLLILGAILFLPVLPIFEAQMDGEMELLSDYGGLVFVDPVAECPARTLAEYRSIWERNIFGKDQPEALVEKPGTVEILLENADIGLRLVGTAVMENSGKSLAMLEHKDTGLQESCREGSRLGLVLVKRILQNRVIIDAGAGEMILSMDNNSLRGIGKGDVQIARVSLESVNVSASAYPSRLSREELIKEYPDYTSLMDTAKIETQFHAGRPRGILIRNIDEHGLFGKVGLQDGDVIKEVNGEQLAGSTEAVKIYDRLKHGGRVNLGVQRGKESLRLRFYVG